MKQSLVTLHKTYAVLAFIMIASFFSSSLISELFADHATVRMLSITFLGRFGG